jgi:probable phosphoglycerate mutase
MEIESLMRAFYYTRHGQTDANVHAVYSGGAIDIPLNSLGLQQAEELGNEISPVLGVDKILCSPLGRTRKTCEFVNKNIQVPVEYREELREWDLGEADGKSYDLYPDIRQTACDPPNGETREQFFKRIGIIAEELKATDKTILVVAHAQVWRALCVNLGIELNHIKNCVLYKVWQENDGWKYQPLEFALS